MIIRLIEYLRQRIKMVIWCCYGLLLVIVHFAFAVDRYYAHSWAERYIPIFWSLFGFGAAVIVIFVARWFGRAGIYISSDYYDKHDNG